MQSRILAAALLSALLLAYLLLAGWQGWLLLTSGSGVGVALGLAVLALPPIGAYVLWREISFGVRSHRLARELAESGRWPADELPRMPSGRPVRDAADEVFALRRADVERAPDDWESWFRLGLAYEDARDRRRARESIRRAIALHG